MTSTIASRMKERARTQRPVGRHGELLLDIHAERRPLGAAQDARLHEGADHRHEDERRAGEDAGQAQRQDHAAERGELVAPRQRAASIRQSSIACSEM